MCPDHTPFEPKGSLLEAEGFINLQLSETSLQKLKRKSATRKQVAVAWKMHKGKGQLVGKSIFDWDLYRGMERALGHWKWKLGGKSWRQTAWNQGQQLAEQLKTRRVAWFKRTYELLCCTVTIKLVSEGRDSVLSLCQALWEILSPMSATLTSRAALQCNNYAVGQV